MQYVTGALILILVTTRIALAQTMIYLSSVTPGTETTTLVANGDFEQGSTGWTRVNQMYAQTPPATAQVPAASGSKLAASHIDNHTINHFQRVLTLRGQTEYVLSAYMWHLGDVGHNVNVVVDLADQSWEPQLALYPHMSDTYAGVFAYQYFITPPGTQQVTLRLFSETVHETDNEWTYFPVGGMWDNIAVTEASRFRPPVKIVGDFDGSDMVDAADLVQLTQNWLAETCGGLVDIAGDCRVDLADVNAFAQNWMHREHYRYDIYLGSQREDWVFEGIGWTIQPADMINGGWTQQKPLLDYAQHDTWRVMLYPMLWEPVNDNADPWDHSGFDWDTPFMNELVRLIQYAKDNGISVAIANWSCGQMGPDSSSWMGATGKSGDHPHSNAEFAESLAALIDYLRNTRGLTNVIRLALWNEPSAHYRGAYPTQFSTLYKAVSDYLNWLSPDLRDSIELVACDDHDWWRQYIGPTLNHDVGGVWNVDWGTDAVSMHHYNGDINWIAACRNTIINNNPDGVVEPLYMYELGGTQLPLYASEAQKYRYSLEQASNTIDAINAGAKLVAWWIWDGGGLEGYGATAVHSCGTQPNPGMFYPAALLTRAVRKDSKVCSVSVQNHHGSYVKAAKLETAWGQRSVLVTNDNALLHGVTTINVHFDDLPGTRTIHGYYNDGDGHYNGIHVLGTWTVSPSENVITVDIPDESIVVFTEHQL